MTAAKNAPIDEAEVAPEAEAPQAIDQRTGRPAGAGITREQVNAQLKEKVAADELAADDLISETEQRISIQASGPLPAAIDARRLRQQVRAELETMLSDPERSPVAARALQRIDERDHIVRRGTGMLAMG